MNNNKYNSVFDSIYQYVKGSTMAAWVFALAIITLMIGINGFAEDTYSSYVGIQMIEQTFSVKPASWEMTYWMMSLSFQVVTVIAFFAYLSDKKNNWWGLWLSIGAQAIDFVSDVWYRSNGAYTNGTSIFVSVVLTFLFFTVGSEVALTFGLGLTAKLFVEGMAQTAIFFRNLVTGVGQAMKIISSGFVGDRGATDSSVTHQIQDVRGNPAQKPNNPPNQQFNNQNQGRQNNQGNGGNGRPVDPQQAPHGAFKPGPKIVVEERPVPMPSFPGQRGNHNGHPNGNQGRNEPGEPDNGKMR